MEILDISHQSVSLQKNNLYYPDIKLIPIIANFFGVSKVFNTMPQTDAPKVYYQNNMLYFDTKLFDTLVAEQIRGVTSCVGLKSCSLMKILSSTTMTINIQSRYRFRALIIKYVTQ